MTAAPVSLRPDSTPGTRSGRSLASATPPRESSGDPLEDVPPADHLTDIIT